MRRPVPDLPRPRRTAAALLAAAALVLSGCTSIEGSGEKGYVSAAGQVVEIPPAERGAPVELSGETVSGGPASLEELRGDPVVVPLWGYWCGPCHAEAPILADVAREYADRVGFLGLALRNESRLVDAQRFEEQYDLPYESVFSEEGSELLAFDPPPRAMPSIVVLDGEGRVASVILGELPSEGTLTAVVDQVLEDEGTDEDTDEDTDEGTDEGGAA